MNRLQPSGIVAALAWLVLSFLALPAFAVIPVSFTDTRYLAMPQEHLSLQHWRTFLSSPEWLGSIWQSLWIATVSTAAPSSPARSAPSAAGASRRACRRRCAAS